jgi:hypothetical protein
MKMRYEEIISEPEIWFPRIFEFAGLSLSDASLNHICHNIHKKSVGRWKNVIDTTDLDEAMPIMHSMLRTFEYLS